MYAIRSYYGTACEKVCPKNSIKVENEMGEITAENEIFLNNDTCINCMVCSEICPVGAIVYEDRNNFV